SESAQADFAACKASQARFQPPATSAWYPRLFVNLHQPPAAPANEQPRHDHAIVVGLLVFQS
ncbi:MAG TPA: hypothetical protein VFU60_19570, partial [Ktedonobacterales bacterium]|nr:hypothetical protein [Ktedonobacterales bacterium]